MKRYFITGTDTDCGKTYIMCELLKLAQQQGRSAIGLKPVSSGCHFSNGKLVSEDASLIQQYAPPGLDICHWYFLPPISPHIAAEKKHERLSAADITRFCLQDSLSGFDEVYIEGAGGLMAPLNESETWIDFAKQADLEVILVVGMRLGCLNHALLTVSAMVNQQLNCAGWIANCLDPNMLALEENIATLRQRIKMPLLGTIAYQGGLTGSGLSF